jgi:hypothetical protein
MRSLNFFNLPSSFRAVTGLALHTFSLPLHGQNCITSSVETVLLRNKMLMHVTISIRDGLLYSN